MSGFFIIFRNLSTSVFPIELSAKTVVFNLFNRRNSVDFLTQNTNYVL